MHVDSVQLSVMYVITSFLKEYLNAWFLGKALGERQGIWLKRGAWKGKKKNEKTNKQQHRWVWPTSKLSAPLVHHVRESGFQNPGIFCLWNPESGNFLLVESGILGLGIRNTAQGIRNPTNDCNPESKFHWQRLESSTWKPESTA